MIQYIQTIAKDADTREMDSNISRVFNSLYPNPLLRDPVIVKDLVFIANTDLMINHKLNRKVTGFIVINSSVPAVVFQSATLNVAPTALIILQANINATLDILFF